MDLSNKVQYGPHFIPGGPVKYIRTGDLGLNVRQAHQRIRQTLNEAFNSSNPDSVLHQLSDRFGYDPDSSVRLSFINYGNMQLVYQAAFSDASNLAVLINQPHTPLGTVRAEFDNLNRLVEIDPRLVVKPYAYFSGNTQGHELYVSEYIDPSEYIDDIIRHARDDDNFHLPSSRRSPAVKSAMIAILVGYYDEAYGRGLADVHAGEDDYILIRVLDNADVGTVLSGIRIIAARSFIKIPLEEYLLLLKREFVIGTNRDDPAVQSGEIRINTKSPEPMTTQEIEAGIELGLELRSQRLSA